MSRATVRAAIATWFAPPNVAFLNTIFTSEPKIAGAQSAMAGTAPGTASGAYGIVYIEKEDEMRIGVGGSIQGEKHLIYDVGLIMHFFSSNPTGEGAMADFDTMIEYSKERLRAGRATVLGTAGTANPLFNVGEDKGGISLQYDLPKRDANMTYIWAVLQFGVEEIIVA